MEKLLRNLILQECSKHIDRHHEYLFELEQSVRRKSQRYGLQVAKTVLRPQYWTTHHGFDPFSVRTSKRLDTYAWTLAKKLKSGTYQPQTSIVHSIPKPSGGQRDLNVFQVPDAAISRYVYKSLLKKNVNIFSNYAYAYREDRNAHDAILRIASDWRTRNRIYVAEFDFSKFFDNISHKYLWDVVRDRGFLYTDLEEQVLTAFLESRSSQPQTYNPAAGVQRKVGIPQGTSVSLFLANVACWELDQEMERIGVQFARYADDTLIWSNSYDQIVRAYDAMIHSSKQMGVPINLDKSEGITLISDRAHEELEAKAQVRFLGYSISLKRVSVSESSVASIKERISYIIYENLIQPLRKGVFNSARLGDLDKDYMTALAQIRRYMYGGLDDTKLRRFKLGIVDHLNFRGVMSYYPVVNDECQLKTLDGWLIHTFKQALRWRDRAWQAHTGARLPGPSADWIEEIANIKRWMHPVTKQVLDFRIPSFLQINRAMRIGLTRGGTSSVTNPRSRYYPGQTNSTSKP